MDSLIFTEPACEHVEGGRYVGPEFQLGQVYDGGSAVDTNDVVLYRPVYVCVSSLRGHMTSNHFAGKQTPNNRNNTAVVERARKDGSSS